MRGFPSIFHARSHRKNERNPVHSFYGLVHSFLRRCWFISQDWRSFRKIFAFFASYSAIIFDGLALGWYLPQRHCAYRMACKLLFMSFLVRAKMMGVWRIFRQIVIVIHLSFDRWFEQFFVACSHSRILVSIFDVLLYSLLYQLYIVSRRIASGKTE